MPEHIFNLQPSPPDNRDKLYLSRRSTVSLATVPPALDVRVKYPPIFDQAQEGSCAGNDGVARRMFGTTLGLLSRQALYAMARQMDGVPLTEDSGTTLATICKVLLKIGACPEADDPYRPSTFSVKPSAKAIADCAARKITSYASVSGTLMAKLAIMEGKPPGIGMDVYESFEGASVASTGEVPLPKRGEKYLGGHAVALAGWDDTKKCAGQTGAFLVRNSWGTGWGWEGGHFWLPYGFWGKGWWGATLVGEMRNFVF